MTADPHRSPNRNPARLIKARRNSWGKKNIIQVPQFPQFFVIFWKKSPKQSEITMHHKLKLAKSFYKSKTLIPIWQKKKTFPISKNFSITNYYFPGIIKISAHLGMHASQTRCTTCDVSQRKRLRKHTRTHSPHKQNIHAYFVPLKCKKALCVAPRIPINKPTSGWMQIPRYAASPPCCLTLTLSVGKFCKIKNSWFQAIMQDFWRNHKMFVLNQLFTSEGPKQRQNYGNIFLDKFSKQMATSIG